MKIKTVPEDFFVEEILNIQAASKGDYGLYILEKKNNNTVELLLEISKRLRLPFPSFGYGGRKDKHAFTRQYVTIPKNKKPFEIEEKNWALKPAGFLDRPMGPDLIGANSFSIVLRDLGPKELFTAQQELPKIKEGGFANYFDDQRFGTFDKTQGFLAEKILKKHFNGALKIYLTHSSSSDTKEEKSRKKFFFENWSNWAACLNKAEATAAQMIFSRLISKPKDFLPILREIPRHELTLYFSAYQGFLWNEVLRRLIRQKIGDLLMHKGLTGDYLFFDTLDDDARCYWSNIVIPTAASKMNKSDDEIEKITKNVFEDNQLSTPMFNITKVRQAYFKSTDRRAVAIPEGLVAEYADDEAFPGSKKLKLKFSLPRGSYATMLIKRIFGTSNY